MICNSVDGGEKHRPGNGLTREIDCEMHSVNDKNIYICARIRSVDLSARATSVYILYNYILYSAVRSHEEIFLMMILPDAPYLRSAKTLFISYHMYMTIANESFISIRAILSCIGQARHG